MEFLDLSDDYFFNLMVEDGLNGGVGKYKSKVIRRAY